jgi:hypothetical protein
MTVRQIRRVMAAREILFKFGVFVPRSEREAESSPEAPRWKAGKDLEWLRLREQGTFERDWTWERIRREHAAYKRSDIGFLFYVFDYKFSGEHRVRLVFDGSRQSAETYDETYQDKNQLGCFMSSVLRRLSELVNTTFLKLS